MPGPLIAVSAAIEELETAFGRRDCTKLTAAYTDAIYAAGGRPVILPVVEAPPAGLLDRMDGLVLTGGGDLDPQLYGQQSDPTTYGVRRDRDDFETALYGEAMRRGIPVLAICRGMQLVNVLRGGSLIQQLEADGRHWQEIPPEQAGHKVDLVGDSSLAATVNQAVLGVNSYHHQALREIGAGLRVTARCGEVVEAVEAVDADIVCVQWHPEQMAATDEFQRALFEAFVRRASGIREPSPKENDPCPTT